MNTLPTGLEKATILVTGAGGFIGRHVVKAAAEEADVIAVSRSGDAIDGAHASVALDVTELGSIEAIFAQHRPDIVINCAAHGTSPANRDHDVAMRVNVEAPHALFRSAKRHGAKRFLHLGTCEEYGRSNAPMREDQPLAPEGVYATSKAAGTALLMAACAGSDLDVMILRPFGTWGPGEGAHRLVPSLIAAAGRNGPVGTSDGCQFRDFALVRDVAKAIAELALSDKWSGLETVNLGSGEPTSVRAFSRSVAEVLNCADRLDRTAHKRRPNEMPVMVPDVSHLHRLLGWLPRGFDAEVVRQMRDDYTRDAAKRGFEQG